MSEAMSENMSEILRPITRIRAKNFRSLANVDIPLSPLTVLIGPNGSGKSNVLGVLRFLAATARFDLLGAIDEWGGFDRILRQAHLDDRLSLAIEGSFTAHSAAESPDVYSLELRGGPTVTLQSEDFTFIGAGGRERKINVTATKITVRDADGRGSLEQLGKNLFDLASEQNTALATLPKVADSLGGQGIRELSEFLARIRVLEPNVAAACQPAPLLGDRLAADASNLADALLRVHTRDPDSFGLLVEDMRQCLPGLKQIHLDPIGGATEGVTVRLEEAGLRSRIDLADASFGTVRALALFTALHEPDPPPFLAIEEIDHGLHPYALDVLADRIRSASSRMQVMVATHSPTFVNRMRPEELIVCDREPETGASVIPAISAQQIADAMNATDWQAGELWFNGVLGGVPA